MTRVKKFSDMKTFCLPVGIALVGNKEAVYIHMQFNIYVQACIV